MLATAGAPASAPAPRLNSQGSTSIAASVGPSDHTSPPTSAARAPPVICKVPECATERNGVSEYCLAHRKGLQRSECLERRPGSVVVWGAPPPAQQCSRVGCDEERDVQSPFCAYHRPDRDDAAASSSGAPPQGGGDTIRLGNYLIGGIIGSGAFCEVRTGHHLVSKQKYAVKVVSIQAVKDMRCEDLICTEIQMLLEMRHPNVIRSYEAMRTTDCIVMVMDFMSGGELFDVITKHGCLSADQSLGYYQDLLRGVCALHGLSIAHRDLKPENLLLEGDCLKIADLGFCAYQAKGEQLWEALGTPEYQAPEVTPGQSYCGFAADMWSCGVVLYAMVMGTLPFDGNGCDDALREAQLAGVSLPAEIEGGPKDIINRLITLDPRARPSAYELLTDRNAWTCVDANTSTSSSSPPPATPSSSAAVAGAHKAPLSVAAASSSSHADPMCIDPPRPSPSPPNTTPPKLITLKKLTQLVPCSSENEQQLFSHRPTPWTFQALFEETKSFLGSFGKTNPTVPSQPMPQRSLVRPRARWRRR